MAEIKSTMEMVMERAAKMAAEADNTATDDKAKKIGMRLAADFLNRKTTNLLKALSEQPPEEQLDIRQGITETLLRNIVLPRDEMLIESGKLAIQGVLDLGQSAGELTAICSEITQILEQYGQHKDQMKQQLDEAIRGQMEQKLAEQGEDLKGSGSLNPAMHPQYQEELSKMLTDLNNQYNQALDQRKEMIQQRLGL